MTRARRLLVESGTPTEVPLHEFHHKMFRRSLKKLGFVPHPTDPHMMVHPRTGRTYYVGWGHPHD